MKASILSTLAFAATVLSAPLAQQEQQAAPHEDGGEEHIVIIDKSAPIPPRVADILERLALDESNPDVHHVFNNSAFQGFAANMKHHCLDLLANMTDVSLVEATTTVQSTLHHHRRSSLIATTGDTNSYDTRTHSPWGLQRISTNNADTISGDPSRMDYSYNYANTNLGAAADVYIIDTGLYTQHNDFGDRAHELWSFDSQPSDPDGHGTHVAGTAAGHLLGVASNANVFGVRALDSEGGGWSSNVVAAINRVIQAHDSRQANPDIQSAGSVMSLSLAASAPVAAIDTAIQSAIEAGVHACVAAGNTGTDACASSPASAGGTHGAAITVGSVGMTDARSSFSNYGSCVDVYAPGEDIISAWPGDPNYINSLSGTSMATPHVTGIVAYAIGANATLAADPGLMKEWVRNNGELLGREKVGDKGWEEVGEMILANNGVRGGVAGSADDAVDGVSDAEVMDEESLVLEQKVSLSSLLGGKVRRALDTVVSWPDSVVKLAQSATSPGTNSKTRRSANAPSFPTSILDLLSSTAATDVKTETAKPSGSVTRRKRWIPNPYQYGEEANTLVMEHGFIGKISNSEALSAAGVER